MTKGSRSPDIAPPHITNWVAKQGAKSRHRDAVELIDLLTDLSEIDILPLPLLERIAAAKNVLMAQSLGGKKGAEASKKARRGPHSKRASIAAAAIKYGTLDGKQITAIARSTGSTVRYVRMVLGLKKTER